MRISLCGECGRWLSTGHRADGTAYPYCDEHGEFDADEMLSHDICAGEVYALPYSLDPTQHVVRWPL